MQFWYVTPCNNKLQFLYLTCLHDSRQLFPLQLRGWFQCCLFWATVKRRQYSILILSFLTATISLKTAFSFKKWIFSNFCSFSIPRQSCHCLMFPQPFPSPLYTYSTPFYSPLKKKFASRLSSKIAAEHSRAVPSNHLADNYWGNLQQNYEKSQDFPNYHFSLKGTPLPPSSKYNYIFRKSAKIIEDRYLVVFFAFEMSSSQLHIVYVQEWEYIHKQMNSECLPKYSSCIKSNNLCDDGVKITPFVCTSSWHHSVWTQRCKASSFNTLLKMYLSLLGLLWQQNLGWGTAQRHCTIHSAAIHLTKESRRT